MAPTHRQRQHSNQGVLSRRPATSPNRRLAQQPLFPSFRRKRPPELSNRGACRDIHWCCLPGRRVVPRLAEFQHVPGALSRQPGQGARRQARRQWPVARRCGARPQWPPRYLVNRVHEIANSSSVRSMSTPRRDRRRRRSIRARYQPDRHGDQLLRGLRRRDRRGDSRRRRGFGTCRSSMARPAGAHRMNQRSDARLLMDRYSHPLSQRSYTNSVTT